MPPRVHALLVARPEPRATAALHLTRTLAALDALDRRPDAVTIVLCGTDPALRDIAAASGAEGVIEASATTSYARAIAMASLRVDDAASVWLLAQDTAPEPDALTMLEGTLERSPSAAIAAPKLVAWNDRDRIVSLGVTMTRFGRAIGLSDGQFDQGQHDADEDVLGSDIRGILIRASQRKALIPDPALAGADEGLDLGVRARMRGQRVAVAPLARIAVAGDGTAGLPSAPRGPMRRPYATRVAALHRRLSYAEAWVVPLHWLAILPIAVWRTLVHLVAKRPGSILPEWGAAFVAMVQWGAIARARKRLRTGRATGRAASWALIAPLRISAREHRRWLDVDPAAATNTTRGDLHFFSGGGAWAVLGGLVVGVVAFIALLAWPALGGGGLLPLRPTVAGLWADAAYGMRSTGIDEVLAADPFAGVIAVLGSLWPWAPSFVLVLLWILALPLAVLGGWFAATRVTDRPGLRIVGGIVWALAPTFLTALVDGRPAAVLAHLLLPWLFFTASVAHRSWGAAGAGSILLAAVLACAPSLGPAAVVLWIAMMVLCVVAPRGYAPVIAVSRGQGVARIAWLIVPALVLFAPLIGAQLRAGNPWGLLADPGLAWLGPQVSADVAGRGLLAAGFPTTDPSGWGVFLSDGATWWVPLLVAPLFLLAVLAPLTPRWPTGTALLVIVVLGGATAFAAVGIQVSFAGENAVALWPGPGLSLAWIGVAGAALVTLDAGILPSALVNRPGAQPALRRLRIGRPIIAVLVTVGIGVVAVAPLTAMLRGEARLTNGPTSTLPAYVAVEGRDAPVGTLVLTPQSDGGIAAEIVWGASETLGGQSTLQNTRLAVTDEQQGLAEFVADFITPSSFEAAAELRSLGVKFVLLAPDTADTAASRTLRLGAATAIDQRDGLASVGDTDKGMLWRAADTPDPRPEATRDERERAAWIATAQLVALGAALLLAVPTTASRRAARRTPRIVGPTTGEAL